MGPRGVEQERVAALGLLDPDGVVANQRPRSRSRRHGIAGRPVDPLDSVGNAMAVGEHEWTGRRTPRPPGTPGSAADQRRSRRGRRTRCRTRSPGARDPSSARSCRRATFPPRQRGRFGHLAAGVRVHLGVEDEHVDVAPAREDVVEPTGADVVGPPVAADDPDSPSGHGGRPRSSGRDRVRGQGRQPPLQLLDPLALRVKLHSPAPAAQTGARRSAPADLLAQLLEPGGARSPCGDRQRA